MNTAQHGVGTVRTFDTTKLGLGDVISAKAGRRVTLCFPCHNEAATIGPLVASARRHLLENGVIDDLLVLDDRSTDDTGAVALDAGARVVSIEDVHAVHGIGHGKGNAMWASLTATDSEFVVWCDGDVTSFSPNWPSQLVWPLLTTSDVHLVKATYDRPTQLGGGGRTTELVARPLLSAYAPWLAGLGQPLSGEAACRRDAIETIPMVEGWGVEIAMLLDLAGRYGPAAIGQVDLGTRHHRHRSLHALSVQAAEVLATALGRLGMRDYAEASPSLIRADGSRVPLNLAERPPLRRE